MVNNIIFNRLYNDVIAYIKNEDVYVVKQGSTNDNIHPYDNPFKHYVDGIRISQNEKRYQAYLYLDRGVSYSSYKDYLTFTSYDGSAGLNLLNFINSVINSANPEIVTFDGLVVKDAKRKMFNTVTLTVVSSVIDDEFIKTVAKYFHHLKKIEFQNCIIKSGCNFYKIEALMEFYGCTIENIRSFNDCKADIKLSRTGIRKICPTTINSKYVYISQSEKMIDVKKLFLSCSFPELIQFNIYPNDKFKNYSFESDFEFLPYSAPKLEDLVIQGKVSSLEFLTKFKSLLQCSILSIYDDHSFFYTDVTDVVEKDNIFKRNKKEYEVEKILNPNKDDKYIISELEKQRILRLSHFLSTISYSEEDKKFFQHADLIDFLIKKGIDLDVGCYYKCYFDRLYLNKQESDLLAQLKYEDKYKIINNMLYVYKPPERTNQIVITKKFIYSSNGMPIIFMGYRKPIRTVQEALETVKNTDIRNFNLDEFNYHTFVDELKKYDMGDISVGEFIDYFGETVDIRISGDNFLQFGEYGRKIAGLFEECERRNTRLDNLKSKQKIYINLMVDLFIDNYSLFSISEKAYLIMHHDDWIIGSYASVNESFLSVYKKLVPDEDEILESINIKTMGLYSKYLSYIKLIYRQYYMLDNPYDVKIKELYIKKLDFK